MKLILINGAPRSGKDHAAGTIMENFDDRVVHLERFSRPLKEAFAAIMMAPIDDFYNVEGYENDKEKSIPLLGVSYRQFQIDLSEKFFKPLYGLKSFAKLLLSRLEEVPNIYPVEDYGDVTVVVPDCGFQIEVDTIIDDFPLEDILLIRLDRAGTSFDGDSRERVEPHRAICCVDITNDGTEAFERLVLDAVLDFLDKKDTPNAS